MALIMNCFIINLYYRNYEMSPWARRLLMGRLARLARVDVPIFRTQEYMDKLQKDHNAHELPTLTQQNSNDANHDLDDDSAMSNGRTESRTYFPSDVLSREEVSHHPQRLPSVHKRNGNSGGSLRRPHHHMGGRGSGAQKTEEQAREENKKLLSEDWKIAARVVDRVMLVIAVTVGVVSFLAIFCQAPRGVEMFIPSSR